MNIAKLISAPRSENVLNKLSTKELADFVAKAGKRANERLASQERAGQEYTAAYNYVTSKMVHRDTITETSKSGHVKFITRKTKDVDGKRVALSRNELLYRANEIKGYLNAKTSTTRGLEETYRNQLETFNKNNDVNLTMNEFNRIVTNEQFEHFKKEYGSGRIVKLLQEHGYDVTIKVVESNARNIREQNKLIKSLESTDFEKVNINETPF